MDVTNTGHLLWKEIMSSSVKGFPEWVTRHDRCVSLLFNFVVVVVVI